MIRRLALTATTLWAVGSGQWAEAQMPIARAPSPQLAVYLITIGEGERVWEKYGHNALWFVDSTARIDEAYNWGIFDFTSPGFAPRFLKGTALYSVERYPGDVIIDFFTKADRTLDVQRLNLTPAQALKALEYARWNAKVENRFYRYDYFLDNCSTRVRDVIDLATGGALKAATTGTVPRTFRSESVRLMDDLKLAQFGINLALGRRADRPLSLWENMFVPMRLRDALRDVKIAGPGGASVPLVSSERVVHTTTSHVERTDAPRLWVLPLILGIILAVDLAMLGIIGERNRGVDIAFRGEAVLWAFVSGLFGLVILLAWTATRHTFWANNVNLLLLNPLALYLVPLILMAFRNARWARPAAITSVLIALGSALALILDGIPGLGQPNLALVALALPPNFAIAFVLWRRTAAQK